MSTFSNIVCKTVGIAGMSAVLYDAYSLGRANSRRQAQNVTADYFERVHAGTRTLNTESQVNNAIQKGVKNFRIDNSIVPVYGSVKGFVTGFLKSLGENILPVSLATLALATKGTLSKIGAWGLAATGLYTVAKEGFGLGKISPMD